VSLMKRLERLEPALSVRERFLIALRDYQEGKATDPNVTRLEQADRPEYDRYARLVIASNERLGGFAWMLKQQAAWNEHDLDIVVVLEAAALQLEEQESLPREEPTKRWRKRQEVTVPFFLRGTALELREMVLARVDDALQNLGAIEAVWSEAEDELGADPVHPEVRGRLADCRKALLDLRQRAGTKKRVLGPPAEMVESMRQQLRDAAGLEAPR